MSTLFRVSQTKAVRRKMTAMTARFFLLFFDSHTSTFNKLDHRSTEKPRRCTLRFVPFPCIGLVSGIVQWLECRARDCKVAGSNPCRSGGRTVFSRVNFLDWLLFPYPFHPRVNAVARKRSRSFCQKCRWQVTAKHTYTLLMWLCMKRHGAWMYGVHRTFAETAAVSGGTSHASALSAPLRWIFKNAP